MTSYSVAIGLIGIGILLFIARVFLFGSWGQIATAVALMLLDDHHEDEHTGPGGATMVVAVIIAAGITFGVHLTFGASIASFLRGFGFGL